MRRNIDQKEQSRQNNDVGVHRDVAIERHFSDTILMLGNLDQSTRAGVSKETALLASNKNGSCYSDRRDECTTTTKFVSLNFTSFINLVFQTKVFQQTLAHHSERATQKRQCLQILRRTVYSTAS